MGILEADPLSPIDDKDRDGLEESSAEAKRLLADEAVSRLMMQAANGTVAELAKQGIWIWLEGEDQGILGLHVKQEKGRTYDAQIRADFEPEGSHYLMEYRQGAEGWLAHMSPGDELPDELVSALGDACQAEEEIARKAQRARAWSRYHNQTTHPAYVTNMGPGKNLPR